MMAPQYAPSLRTSLPVLAILLETVFVLLFAFFVSYDVVSSRPNELFYYTYADFQDVHVMVFLGFGFLATFLVRYGFSSSGFNLLIAVMAVQWATLLNGFFFSVKNEKIHINLKSLITANLCAASALISMGCVLGKTNPVQLLLMGLIEVTGFVLNQWIIHYFLGGDQVNIIMQLCLFGACFGVTLSWSLYRPGLETRHEKERSTLVLNLFCMMGTLFLWMFWPSFNSVLTEDTTKKMNAVFSTYFSLAASTVTTFGCSVLTSKKGKINVYHIHNATLAGGVAVGAAVTVIPEPWIAMTIGVIAGLISTLGLKYIKPHMKFAFDVHDTCGVLYVFGLPGIMGFVASIILQLVAATNLLVVLKDVVFQLTALSVTLTISLTLGMITGFLLKLNIWKPTQDKKCFDDQAFWEFPHLVMEL